MSNAPITSSSQTVALLQQQLADIASSKSQALATIVSVTAAGLGPSYSISSAGGSESLDMVSYLRLLNEQVQQFAETERIIIQQLQDLQPFNVVRHLHTRHAI